MSINKKRKKIKSMLSFLEKSKLQQKLFSMRQVLPGRSTHCLGFVNASKGHCPRSTLARSTLNTGSIEWIYCGYRKGVSSASKNVHLEYTAIS